MGDDELTWETKDGVAVAKDSGSFEATVDAGPPYEREGDARVQIDLEVPASVAHELVHHVYALMFPLVTSTRSELAGGRRPALLIAERNSPRRFFARSTTQGTSS